ncbi:MAG: DUF4832 domain-containing protein, partial [Planctomycetia bacterium]|nr:DUF4832 domain-containing protein [Planctomycetia bacterium]
MQFKFWSLAKLSLFSFFVLTLGLVIMVQTQSVFAADNNASAKEGSSVIVCPGEYPNALRNPLKGFRVDTNSKSHLHEFSTITRCYLKWNELENDESDTIEKIRQTCDKRWKDVEKHGIKVIPRVYLDWDRKPGNEYWPADMQTGDYSSEQFKKRVVRLIERLGQCWDNDPRVAWVQLGIIGCWGEHHTPSPTPEMQKLLTDAFKAAFKNKKVLVRHPHEFTDFEVGYYWDSWAHIQQIYHPKQGGGLEKLLTSTKRWQVCPIEGETAYNWGKAAVQPGNNPNDTLSDPVHLDFLLDSIRRLHCTGLGWIASYDASNPVVHAGAEKVQKAFGYRFVLKEFSCPRNMQTGTKAKISFSVVNTGSAPFYENWPVEFSLLDTKTHEPVWKTVLTGVDIRAWLPGDDWDNDRDVYRTPAKTYNVNASVQLPDSSVLANGEYIAALAVLDPAGMRPNLR